MENMSEKAKEELAIQLKTYAEAIWEHSVVRTWRELEGIAADIYAESKTMPTYSIISKFFIQNLNKYS